MNIEKILPDSLSADSIKESIQTVNCIVQLPEKTTLENICSIATVIIAFVNIFLIIYIFAKNNKKDKVNSEKNRKINLLKTLVLDYNMNKFYSFFKDIVEKTLFIHANNLSIDDKSKINDELKDIAADFRQSFIDIFLAIDKALYNKILEKTDFLIDRLTDTIFDEGINLSHKPKFDELVTKEIRESKTEIIKILFSYEGE